MADTLSCQRETLHSQQLRSKKSIDSDHGIYRYRAALLRLLTAVLARCCPEPMRRHIRGWRKRTFKHSVGAPVQREVSGLRKQPPPSPPVYRGQDAAGISFRSQLAGRAVLLRRGRLVVRRDAGFLRR
jgi:hypothetical protein